MRQSKDKMSNLNKLKQYSNLILLPLLISIGVVFVVYLIINFPALWQKFNFEYQTKIKGENPSSTTVFLPDIESTNFQVKKTEDKDKGQILNNHLYISKISVSAPISWQISDENMLNALEKGAAHLDQSKLPTEKGNVFITGHSSYFWWNKGEYKTIFALLPKLTPGDLILITYGDQVFKYKVRETMTVSPNQVGVIDSGETNELTLMTCVPVGTNLSRFIVKANLITGVKSKKTSYKPPIKINESILLLTSLFN